MAEVNGLKRDSAVATGCTVRYVTRAIEQIVAWGGGENGEGGGQVVLGRDQNDPDGLVVRCRIGRTYRRRADHLQVLSVRDADGREQTIRVTDEHPFYVAGQGWSKACDLAEGDVLLGAAGEALTVTGNLGEDHPEGVTVYNLEVEGAHTYFVRAEGSDGEPVWVHNASAAYAKGSARTNATVDAVTAEIESATTQAEAALRAVGTGGTRWGRIYQRYAGTGTWRESVAYGNAVQQVADGIIRGSPVSSGLIANGQLLLNQGSVLGIRNAASNLLRPDYQLLLGGGNVATLDTSTVGMAGKIWKYNSGQTPYLVNISYRNGA